MFGLGVALLAGAVLGWAARASNPPRAVEMKPEPKPLSRRYSRRQLEPERSMFRLELRQEVPHYPVAGAAVSVKPKRRRKVIPAAKLPAFLDYLEGDDDPFAITAQEEC